MAGAVVQLAGVAEADEQPGLRLGPVIAAGGGGRGGGEGEGGAAGRRHRSWFRVSSGQRGEGEREAREGAGGRESSGDCRQHHFRFFSFLPLSVLWWWAGFVEYEQRSEGRDFPAIPGWPIPGRITLPAELFGNE